MTAAAMYAEAWMKHDAMGTSGRRMRAEAETVKVINALEGIIARSPETRWRYTFTIHRGRSSHNPGRAEDEADMLMANLVRDPATRATCRRISIGAIDAMTIAGDANIRAAKGR